MPKQQTKITRAVGKSAAQNEEIKLRYLCPLLGCDAEASRAGDVYRHIVTIHCEDSDQRLYPCMHGPGCFYPGSQQWGNLNSHMLKVHGFGAPKSTDEQRKRQKELLTIILKRNGISRSISTIKVPARPRPRVQEKLKSEASQSATRKNVHSRPCSYRATSQTACAVPYSVANTSGPHASSSTLLESLVAGPYGNKMSGGLTYPSLLSLESSSDSESSIFSPAPSLFSTNSENDDKSAYWSSLSSLFYNQLSWSDFDYTVDESTQSFPSSSYSAEQTYSNFLIALLKSSQEVNDLF